MLPACEARCSSVAVVSVADAVNVRVVLMAVVVPQHSARPDCEVPGQPRGRCEFAMCTLRKTQDATPAVLLSEELSVVAVVEVPDRVVLLTACEEFALRSCAKLKLAFRGGSDTASCGYWT